MINMSVTTPRLCGELLVIETGYGEDKKYAEINFHFAGRGSMTFPVRHTKYRDNKVVQTLEGFSEQLKIVLNDIGDNDPLPTTAFSKYYNVAGSDPITLHLEKTETKVIFSLLHNYCTTRIYTDRPDNYNTYSGADSLTKGVFSKASNFMFGNPVSELEDLLRIMATNIDDFLVGTYPIHSYDKYANEGK